MRAFAIVLLVVAALTLSATAQTVPPDVLSPREQICSTCVATNNTDELPDGSEPDIAVSAGLCELCCPPLLPKPEYDQDLIGYCCNDTERVTNKYCTLEYSEGEPSPTIEDLGLGLTVLIGFVVGIIVLLCFTALRNKDKLAYMPRTLRYSRRVADPDTLAWFKHLPLLKSAKDEEAFMYARGLEAVMMLRTALLGLKLSAGFFLWAWLINAPVNATASRKNLPYYDDLKTRGTQILSTANIPEDDSRWWCVLVTMYVFSTYAYVLLYLEYRRYLQLRTLQLSREKVEHYSIVLTDIPLPKRMTKKRTTVAADEADKMVFDYVANVIGATNVVAATMVWKDAKLAKKRSEWLAARNGLERAEAVEKIEGERPRHKLGKFGLYGEEVDSLDHFRGEQQGAADALAAVQKTNTPTEGYMPVAFVTLRQKKYASMLAQTQMQTATYKWRSYMAPAPADCAWHATPAASTFGTPSNVRYWITVGVNVFMTALVFLWMIPVGFVAGLVNLKELAKTSAFSWLDSIVDNAAGAILSSLLPVLVIIIFFILLLLIIASVTSLQGFFRTSWLHRSVTSKYHYFLIFNLLLGVSVMGSVLQRVDTLAQGDLDFTEIISLIGSGLPPQAYFFMNWLITKAAIGFSLALLRPAAPILRRIFLKFLAKSDRERRAVEHPGQFPYIKQYAEMLVAMAMLLVYAPLQPLMTLFAPFYFAMAYMAHSYNLKYVFVQPFDYAGTLWSIVPARVLWGGVFLMQLVQCVLMLMNEFAFGFLSFPAFGITLWVYVWMRSRFAVAAEYGGVAQFTASHADEHGSTVLPVEDGDTTVDHAFASTLQGERELEEEVWYDLARAYPQPVRRAVYAPGADPKAHSTYVESYSVNPWASGGGDNDGNSAAATATADDDKKAIELKEMA